MGVERAEYDYKIPLVIRYNIGLTTRLSKIYMNSPRLDSNPIQCSNAPTHTASEVVTGDREIRSIGLGISAIILSVLLVESRFCAEWGDDVAFVVVPPKIFCHCDSDRGRLLVTCS